MLLGAGELGRELVTAFQRLGALVIAVDRHAEAPALRTADQSVVAKVTDPEELAALIGRVQPEYVVTESDAVAVDALTAAADGGFADVVPTARSTRLSLDREGLRRLASDELGLPTAPFWFAGSVSELEAVAQHAGYPLVVKPVAAAPGQGESVLLRPDDIAPAWESAVAAGRVSQARVIAETMVEIDYEVTMLTVRSAGPGGGAVHFCEPIGHRQLDGDVLESWQPQVMSPAALDAAKSIAARVITALGGRGIYGVELLVRGDEVYFADVSARPYDSGLVTLRSQRLSEFELHARAILGLPVDTIMVSPAAVQVFYAGTESVDTPDDRQTERATQALSDALAVPESDVRVFTSPQSYPRHRLGVALATAADVPTARERVREVGAALRKLW
ncbi:formate-dependent phosphoribosylglycinamide formyltransferase [Mycobacterium sp.]|jgi:phosphoribosylglycinamide formyltransferase 2|uniref:formate-dependent phosphoribosylglycinamide formyltransferase n=1 Tax=Mycobacterium sp. TaxID=1785 RepID=UPI0039C977EF